MLTALLTPPSSLMPAGRPPKLSTSATPSLALLQALYPAPGLLFTCRPTSWVGWTPPWSRPELWCVEQGVRTIR